jgi:hypothetical protein
MDLAVATYDEPLTATTTSPTLYATDADQVPRMRHPFDQVMAFSLAVHRLPD